MGSDDVLRSLRLTLGLIQAYSPFLISRDLHFLGEKGLTLTLPPGSRMRIKILPSNHRQSLGRGRGNGGDEGQMG